MALTLLKFQVWANNPTTSFPLDMLRYDECFPVAPQDVDRIGSSLDSDLPRGNKITLAHYSDDIRWVPQFKRWESFGWTAVI